MKFKSIILSILCVAMLAITVGCGCQSRTISDVDADGKATFRGIVTSVDENENTMVVRPYNNFNEYNTAKEISVSTDVDKANKSSKIQPGKSVEIAYDGVIEGNNPAKISTVYSINLVDTKGNIIEN